MSESILSAREDARFYVHYLFGHSFIGASEALWLHVDGDGLRFMRGQAVFLPFEAIRRILRLSPQRARRDPKFLRRFEGPHSLGHPDTLPEGWGYLVIDARIDGGDESVVVATADSAALADTVLAHLSGAARMFSGKSRASVMARRLASFWPIVILCALMYMTVIFIPTEAGIVKPLLMLLWAGGLAVLLLRFVSFRWLCAAGLAGFLVIMSVSVVPEYLRFTFPQWMYAQEVQKIESMIALEDVYFTMAPDGQHHIFHFTLHNISQEDVLIVSVGLRAYDEWGQRIWFFNGKLDTYIGFHPQLLPRDACIRIEPTLFEYVNVHSYEYALLGVYTYKGEIDARGNQVYDTRYAAPPDGARWLKGEIR